MSQDLQLVEDVSVELRLESDDDLIDEVDRVSRDYFVLQCEVSERFVNCQEDELFDAFEDLLVFDQAREDRVCADESCFSRVYGFLPPNNSGRLIRSPKFSPRRRADSTPCSSACFAG